MPKLPLKPVTILSGLILLLGFFVLLFDDVLDFVRVPVDEAFRNGQTFWSNVFFIMGVFSSFLAVASRLDAIEGKVNTPEDTRRCKRIIDLIRELIETPKQNVTAPVRIAVGKTLEELILRQVTDYAEGFSRFGVTDKDKVTKDKVTIEEVPFVDTFHLRLVNELPPGSVWLGISRLDEPGAWVKRPGNTRYFDFENALENRAITPNLPKPKNRPKTKNLTVLRIFCLSVNRHDDSEMQTIMMRQSEHGINIRKLVGTSIGDAPDMTVIWVPTSGVDPKNSFDPNNAAMFFDKLRRSYTPICALKVRLHNGSDLDAVTVIAPPDFGGNLNELQTKFENNWKNAEAIV